MKDLEQLKQLILADLEKESKQRIEVATKEQEERINQMNAQYSQQEMAKKTALKQEAKSPRQCCCILIYGYTSYRFVILV